MHRQMFQHQRQQKQCQLQWIPSMAKPKLETKTAEAEKENQTDADQSSRVVAVSVPPSIVSPASTLKPTNLDRFMESVTPFIPRKYLSEIRGQRKLAVDTHPFFCLEDLWESFQDWSAYGAGVPFLLNGKDPIEQYYVPFLSGMQLYIDPSKSSLLGLSLDEKSVTSPSGSEAEIVNLPGGLLFHYLEHEQPYNRRPLADKISVLASHYPELGKCRSCDLLPTSWICVAWYPIYRIPIGPTLKDLDASFLTFHFLSTQTRGICRPQFHAANTRKVGGIMDPTAKISLPVFGLSSYKLKGSIVSPCGPHECEQENSLLQAAEDWLRHLQVMLPDYQFFRAHCSHGR